MKQMDLAARLRRLAFRDEEDPRDVIASLLLAAKEDAALHRQMLFLLRAPPVHREALVNTALHKMQMYGEPKSVRAAFAVLATDAGAKAALTVLQDR